MSPKLTELLADFPVVVSLPVQWGDQDAFGHVNNVVYFRWYETARIAYFDQIGLSESMDTQRVGPILASIRGDYRLQLTYPDTIHVGARVEKIGNSSLNMTHLLVSEQLQDIVAEADSTIVVFDYKQNASVRVPDEFRQVIAKLEGRDV